jgi:uncharacterized protein
MKVLISGSTGLVGKHLSAALKSKGFEVVSAGRADFVKGVDALALKVSQADVVVNLAGAPIVARWSASYKTEILESRIKTTGMLAAAIAAAGTKPRLFISTSAVGIYPDGEVFTEANARYGDDFLAKVCTDWEAAAMKAVTHTRVAIFRLGVVLSEKGGALSKMLLPFKLGLGGPIAGGKQGFSWIHIDDLVNAYLFVIEKQLDGVFNLTSPQITDNAGYTRALGKVLHRPVFMPVPAFALRLLFGEGADMLTSGQKVSPERLVNEGYVFLYPDIEEALADLLK